jgi:hypothetical protein
VYPFLAYVDSKPNFITDEAEVASIIEFNPFLLVDEQVKSKMMIEKHPSGNNVTAPYYQIQEHKVWGATAIILSEIEAIIKNF